MENIRVCVHFSRLSFLTVNWDLRIPPPPSSEERGCWEEQKISSPYPAQKPHGQRTWALTLSCHTTNCCPSSFLKGNKCVGSHNSLLAATINPKGKIMWNGLMGGSKAARSYTRNQTIVLQLWRSEHLTDPSFIIS